MERRRFAGILAGALGASALSPGSLMGGLAQEQPLIKGARLQGWIRDLARFGARGDGGVDRVAFSDADVEGRAYLRSLMENAGLKVRVDLAGNLMGREEGEEAGLSPIMVGSHIDTVPSGGKYDGSVGTLGGLESVLTLKEAGVRLRHPVEVVAFVNEEGGKTGSRILAGEFREEELGLETASGYTIEEGIRRLGGDPDRWLQARVKPGDVAGYLELHVEQGAVLEGRGAQIGVVEGIVGIRRWNVTVRGSANHAGTTPMDQRRDALLAAAGLVECVNRVARSFSGSQVATVGRIEVSPGAPNVIPGEARLTIEIRALSMERIQEVMDGIREEAGALAAKHGTPMEITEFYESAAAPTDSRFREWVESAAADLGLEYVRMPSGAGHDAQAVAHFAPMGMVFIPSAGGLSHHPEEYSRPEDIEAGANVLLGALLRADAGLG